MKDPTNVNASRFEEATFWVTLIGTLATVVALVVAIWVGAHQIRALRRENAERATQELEQAKRRRRAQAECLSAQIHIGPTQHPVFRNEENGGPLYLAEVEVVNASQLPFYTVQVLTQKVGGGPDDLEVDMVQFLPGGQTRSVNCGGTTPRVGGTEGQCCWSFVTLRGWSGDGGPMVALTNSMRCQSTFSIGRDASVGSPVRAPR